MKNYKKENNDTLLKLLFLLGTLFAFVYFGIEYKDDQMLIKTAGILSIFAVTLFGDAISNHLARRI